MKYRYLVYFCSGIGSVFDSQVLELLETLEKKNAFKKIILFLGIRRDSEKSKFLNYNSAGIEIVFFKSYPNYPFFNSLLRKELSKSLKNKPDYKESIIHVRGELLTWHLSKIFNQDNYHKILPDVRGSRIEELKEYSHFMGVQKKLKIWNHKKALKSLRNYDKVSAVSDTLRKYLVENYQINSEKVVVTPSLAGIKFKYDIKERNLIRSELKLTEDDNVVIFSSGDTALWQKVDVLKILADKGILVLNLSKNEIKHKNVINKFVEYEKVPSYLNAADIAVIWRDRSIVNKVASPVKFSEYICCGLPVIANNSVTMVAEYIKNSCFGSLLEKLDELDEGKINRLKMLNREEISAKAQNLVGSKHIADRYLSTYSLIS